MDSLDFEANVYKKGAIKERKFKYENILLILFILLFSLMIIVQALYTLPFSKLIFRSDTSMEGAPLKNEEILYKEVAIELEQQNFYPDNQLKILINGDEETSFSTEKLKLSVKNGDVIEIDATELKHKQDILLSSNSMDISPECLKKISITEPCVQKIVKIKIIDKFD